MISLILVYTVSVKEEKTTHIHKEQELAYYHLELMTM